MNLKPLSFIILLTASAVQAADSAYLLSPSPVVGYDPTSQWLLGGALFVYPDASVDNNSARQYFDILAIHSDQPAWMLSSHFRHKRLLGDADFALEATYSDFSNSWFGDSGDTPADPLYVIEQRSATLRPELAFPLGDSSHWTLFADYRERIEQGVEDYPGLRLFPDENSTALGAGLRSDKRNHLFSPSAGHYAEVRLSWIGEQQTNLKNADDVWQLQAEWRQYASIATDWVWAGRIAAAATDGEPGYLFRYSLGGARDLRGLEANRQRGKRYWLVQNELRFSLWNFISGVAFAESGATGEQDFDPAIHTLGWGLRFALPPDRSILLRLDFACTEGEDILTYLDFGHAF